MLKRICLLLVLCTVIYELKGQELEPRSYAALPKDLNAIALQTGISNGNVLLDPSLPILNLKVTAYTFGLGYVHTFNIAGKLARIAVSVPYVNINGNAQINGKDTSGVRSGFGDARIRFGINLIGSPALDKKQFSQFTQETVVGISLVTSVPTGLYYPDKVLNAGSNRWGFKPEVGVSKRFSRIYLEVYAGAWFYTHNTEYFGQVLSQNPVGSLQAHACYYFKNQMWISVDGNWFNGGQSFVSGTPSGNDFDNWRAGAAWSVPISKGQSIKLQLNKGAFTSRGYNYTVVSLGYQYVFF